MDAETEGCIIQLEHDIEKLWDTVEEFIETINQLTVLLKRTVKELNL